MTEVPEHLLQRSRERRKALGLDTGDVPAADMPSTAAPPATTGETAAAAAPTTPAPTPTPAPEPEPPPPPEPPKPWVRAALDRKKIPLWAALVLLFLPFWIFIYVGTLEEPTREEAGLLAEGRELYAQGAQCAGCHGATGGGGVGPQLSDGEVLLTFPDAASQIAWIANGSDVTGVGNPYGAVDRPGGQRVVGGGMPGFGEALTAEQIIAVTLYERVQHGGLTEEEVEPLVAVAESPDLPENFEPGITPEDVATVLSEVANGLDLDSQTYEDLINSIAGEGNEGFAVAGQGDQESPAAEQDTGS